MPDPRSALPNGLLASGGDLEPGTVLSAYRGGIFPWPDLSGRVLWWSPDPRAVLPLDGFHQSRSLRRTGRRGRFSVSFDRACEAVMAGCAERAEGTWLTPGMTRAYLQLATLGWVHSVEVWTGERLAGGLYGVAIGGFFAAESMFHRRTDASKIALAALVERIGLRGFTLLDVQFLTDHLASLGAIEMSRDDYLVRLRAAIAMQARF
jgi:leucyl/phenylalanyl-tRNA--protein transferase